MHLLSALVFGFVTTSSAVDVRYSLHLRNCGSVGNEPSIGCKDLNPGVCCLAPSQRTYTYIRADCSHTIYLRYRACPAPPSLSFRAIPLDWKLDVGGYVGSGSPSSHFLTHKITNREATVCLDGNVAPSPSAYLSQRFFFFSLSRADDVCVYVQAEARGSRVHGTISSTRRQ